MSAWSPPTTPENSAARMRPGAFRSHTVPSRLIDSASNAGASASSGPVGTDRDLEILYTCINAKIVSFETKSSSFRPGSSPRQGSTSDKDQSGTLPWISPTERTMAAGPLQIYQVISSGVAFLHSGRLLHPIMPMSQCWCVDGESKFVLRVRNDLYYRVELPFDTEEDKAQTEALRSTFGKVLRYEKTPCPFQRGFHVDLPELQDSPSRIRVTPGNTPKTKRWRDKGLWIPQDTPTGKLSTPADQERRGSGSDISIEDRTDDSSVAPESEDDAAESHGQPDHSENEMDQPRPVIPRDPPSFTSVKEMMSKFSTQDTPTRPLETATSSSAVRRPDLLPIRSITEPVLPGKDELVSEALVADEEAVQLENLSPVSSRASFHTASDEELPDNASNSRKEIIPKDTGASSVLRRPHHARDVSEITITASHERPTTAGDTSNQSLSPPATPTLIADVDDVEEHEWHDAVTPPDTLRLRRAAKPRSSSKSPTLVSSNSKSASRALTRPYSPSFLVQNVPGRGKQLTAALIQKAYSLILGPPATLVALMLRIAAKIANGASIFHSYDLGRDMDGLAHAGRSHASSSRAAAAHEDDGWDEDDFGVPLGNTISNASRSSSISRDRVISRGRQRTPNEIWGISPEEESPGAAIRRQEVD